MTSQNLLLVFDVGNTHIVVGVYQDKKLVQNWRLHTNQKATEDEYGILLKNLLLVEELSPKDIKGMAVSSVVPPVTSVLRKLAEKYYSLNPVIVTSEIETGLINVCDNPRELGADRIVNAVAAIEQYGTPVIIVDFGTATTFCVIDSKGHYIGGAISPGVNISSEALYHAASKLTKVEIKKPSHVIGQNTVDAVQSGIFYGYVGLVDGIVKRIVNDMKVFPKVVATGGLAYMICRETETITDVNPFLTLEGLRLIYYRNTNK